MFRHKYKPYNLIPRDKLEKHIYRLLLLMAEKFHLTKAEKGDLLFYASRMNSCFPKGGRNKSKERVYAFLCKYILDRDGRSSVLESDWKWLNERYRLEAPDKEEIENFIKEEINRINKECIPWLEDLYEV